jgi:hypothetical protein
MEGTTTTGKRETADIGFCCSTLPCNLNLSKARVVFAEREFKGEGNVRIDALTYKIEGT